MGEGKTPSPTQLGEREKERPSYPTTHHLLFFWFLANPPLPGKGEGAEEGRTPSPA